MSSISRQYSVLALASLLYFGAPSTPTGTPSAGVTHAPAQRLPVTGISNFSKVTPTLFRGAQPHANGYQELKKMGVDIVVDLRLSGADREKSEVTKAGMQYVSIPWHCLFPSDDSFVRFLKVLRDNPNKKIFVHCRFGDDRTGMAIAAYRMAVEGWTAAEARKEMDQFGFHNLACSSLVGYEKSFPERLKKNPALRELTSDAENGSAK